ncbi:hypothetical protein QCA50_018493 [Cerrena zonata]|uniref:Cytochrome P450 n=1 Tax=Cerrena zonata TaxID=2478898 RepID=A0AAW0FCF7_9APHY
MDSVPFFAVFLCAFILLKWLKQTSKSTLPLPPGPKGYPIIGNLLQMPSTTPWKTFREWSKLYGDVMFLDLPNQPTIVLNSTEAAFDLLEKRSDIYSDRPVSRMHQLVFWDWNPGFLRYSQHWRNHRREFHQFFNQHEVAKYQPIQLRECRAFLRRALHSPNILDQHVRHIFTAIIMKITYDMDITEMDSGHVLLAQEANLGLSIVTMPGIYWVDHFPFLKHLPKWLPGLQFKKIAEYYRPIVEKMRSQPFDEVLQAMREGKATSSLTSKMINRLQQRSGTTNLNPIDDELARNVTGVAYSAAADTTTSATQSFLIAMSLYPGVQRKAQEELDRVIGPNRLPEFSDYDDLVYIQAIALEALRWMVVLPLSVSHCVIRDDTYRGFLIPKGTTVIANAWSVINSYFP